jgi:hypothetical protein
LILITLTWYQSWFYKMRLKIFFGEIFCLPLLQNWVFCLSFSFCNLIFAFSFYNYFGISSSLQSLQFGICVQFLQICFLFWRNRITSRRYLFSFCNLCSVSAIWYFVFRCFCILVLYDCWLWLLKEMIRFSLWVWGWMGRTIRIGAM